MSPLVRLQFKKRISSVYFFPFRNRYTFQYLGRVKRKNSLRCTYLFFGLFVFSRSSFPRFLSFTGERYSVEFGGKAPVIFCPRFFPLFHGVSATISIHLVTPTAVPELNSFHRRGTRELFWHQVSTSSHGDFRPKNSILNHHFLWRKGYYFRR